MSACATAGPIVAAALCVITAAAAAQPSAASDSGPAGNWSFGAVLDLGLSSRTVPLGLRDRGLALGHSDLGASGPLGRHLAARATVAVHQHDRRVEADVEEASIETRTLPAGWSLRAGRFASQVGYLNEQHPHADDFVQRPLLYRAFFGSHWNDDGLRLNWVAPTETLLRLGVERFQGRRLVGQPAPGHAGGVWTAALRAGGDLGREHAWQLGLSYLHNRREALVEDDEGAHHGAHEHHHAHAHAHGAAFSGRHLRLLDLTWKWAPDGNNSREQLRVSYERAQIRRLNRHARRQDRHTADYLSVVWRFAPSWELGWRSDALAVRIPHGDHFHAGRLREQSLMLAWKPSHRQSLRLQVTRPTHARGFETSSGPALQLQYVLSFGAHPAHGF